MIEFNCPHCSYSIRVASENAGKKGVCKSCGYVVRIPKPDRQGPTTIIQPAAEPIPFIDTRTPVIVPRRKVSYGNIIAAFVVSGTALAVAWINIENTKAIVEQQKIAAGHQQITPVEKLPEQRQVNQTKTIPKSAPRKTSAAGKDTAGDALVELISGGVGHVDTKDYSGDTGVLEKDCLKIGLRITNKSDVKKYTYTSWGYEYRKDHPIITDEYGNRYKKVVLSTLDSFVGQQKHKELYPGESVEDLLVFEKPIAKVKSLKLMLPGISITNNKPLYFKFSTP